MNIKICQGSEYARDREGSEYMWVRSWAMLKYAWIRLKQNLKSLYKLHNNCKYIGLFRMLPSIYTGLGKSAYQKNNYGLDLFPEDINNLFDRDLNTVELLNIPGFWIWHGLQMCLCSEYARVPNKWKVLDSFL